MAVDVAVERGTSARVPDPRWGGDVDTDLARLALRSLPETCVMVLDRDLRCAVVGGAATWPGRTDPRHYRGRHIADILPARDWERTRPHYVGALAGLSFEERYVSSLGDVYRTTYGPATDDSGTVRGVVVRFREISGLEETEQQLRQALELFELSFATAPIGKAVVAPDLRYLKVNPALCALVGRSEDALLSCTFHDITHPDDVHANKANYERVLSGEVDGYQLDKRYVKPDGTIVPVQLDVAAVRNADGTVRLFVAQIQDISGRKRTEEALRTLASRDSLTGLCNRAWFCEELDQAIDAAARYGQRPAALLIDLDGFKEVNDTHGHLAGDRHLRSVAAALTSQARRSDRVARLGGDEFAVLLPNASYAQAAAAALRFTDAIASLPTGRGASIGIATYQPGDTAETLYDRADQDMYRAKQNAAETSVLRERPTQAVR